MRGEDTKTPRICFAPSIEDCLNAIGEEYIINDLKDGLLLAFPFEVSLNDPFLRLPDKIADMVPDANWTREHWYLSPVTLSGHLIHVDDYSGYTFYDATEAHKPMIYQILQDNQFTDAQLREFEGCTPAEILANIPTWLSYEIALRLNLHELHAFEWLNYQAV